MIYRKNTAKRMFSNYSYNIIKSIACSRFEYPMFIKHVLYASSLLMWLTALYLIVCVKIGPGFTLLTATNPAQHFQSAFQWVELVWDILAQRAPFGANKEGNKNKHGLISPFIVLSIGKYSLIWDPRETHPCPNLSKAYALFKSSPLSHIYFTIKISHTTSKLQMQRVITQKVQICYINQNVGRPAGLQ